MAERRGAAADAVAAGYEPRDVPARWVLLTGGGIVLVVAVAAALLWLLLGHLRDERAAALPPRTAVETLAVTPPGPRLQADPLGDGPALNAEAERRLAGWGWVDRDAGIARIPIDRAMDLLAAHGWPAEEWRER